MQAPSAARGRKRPVNLTLSENLVAEAKTYTGNLSATVESLLGAYVLGQQQARLSRQQLAEHGQLIIDALDELLSRNWG